MKSLGRLNHAPAAAPLRNVQDMSVRGRYRSCFDVRDHLVSLSNAYQRPDAVRRMPVQSEPSAARIATSKEGRGVRFCHS
jgi:hypothetical protein